MKDFEDKSLYFIVDASSTTCSPIGELKQNNPFDHSSFFTSLFLMTMLVMATSITSVEEQLVEMACAIDKLTKTI